MSNMAELQKNNTGVGLTVEGQAVLTEAAVTPAHARDLGNTMLASVDAVHPEGVRPADSEPDLIKEQKIAQAEAWLAGLPSLESDEAKAVPDDIASEVSLVTQRRLHILGQEDIVDDDVAPLERIRDHAIEAAETLDFEVLELSTNWTEKVAFNAMHEKFQDVSPRQLSELLGSSDDQYEYRALFIRDIIADHAPELLTENLKTILDPTKPLWRVCSAHASILLKHKQGSNISGTHVDQVVTSLPTGNREAYVSEDDEALKPLAEMSEDELALYAQPEALADIRERGYAIFGELNLPSREALLTRSLFETVVKSHDPAIKQAADKRNRALEHQPLLQAGDAVHATRSPEIVEAVLANGLRCGEAVMGNARGTIKYPFTVNLLEVTEKIAEPESVAERLGGLNNGPYGGINLILHRDEATTKYVEGYPQGVRNQRQVFGGLPSTELKSIIIRDGLVTQAEIEKVIHAVVENNMFIPVYNASGESLLTSRQFDQLVAANQVEG
jgi:hypothetical protein